MDEKFSYENSEMRTNGNIEKRMPHFKSTFQIQRNKMFFANDAHFPFTYYSNGMFRDRLRQRLSPVLAYAVRIVNMILRTAGFFMRAIRRNLR